MKKIRKMVPLLFLSLLLGLGTAVSAASSHDNNVIADGIWIGGQDISGMNLSEAAAAMAEYFRKIASSNIEVSIRSLGAEYSDPEDAPVIDNALLEKSPIISTGTIPMSVLDIHYSVDDALREASTLGQSGKLLERYKVLMDLKYDHAELPLSFSYDEDALVNYIRNEFVPAHTEEPQNARYALQGGRITVTANEVPGKVINADLTVKNVLAAVDEGLSDHIKANTAAVTTEAELKRSDLEKMTSVLGYYETRFSCAGENANRGNNVKVAAKFTNGTLVMPGKSISVDKLFKDRKDPANGYKPGNAFSNGQIIQELGGGICQVSTTIYNALLLAELQIDVHFNHSMVVDYVPFGLDATIDWGNKDLVFTNNTDAPIYLEAGTNSDTIVYVRVHGHETRPSNRKVKYVSTVTLEKVYPPLYSLDTSRNPSSNITVTGSTHMEADAYVTKKVYVNGAEVESRKLYDTHYNPSRSTIVIPCNGLGLQRNSEGLPCDRNGDRLLLTKDDRFPVYDSAHNCYLLAKDYKHDANGDPVKDSSGNYIYIGEPVQPETQPPESTEVTESTESTEPAETQPAETEAPEQTQPAETQPAETQATEPPVTTIPETQPEAQPAA